MISRLGFHFETCSKEERHIQGALFGTLRVEAVK